MQDFLRKHYWKAFVVCLIATLLSGGGGSNANRNTNQNENNSFFSSEYVLLQDIEESIPFDLHNPVFYFLSRSLQSPLFSIGVGCFFIMIVVAVVLVTVGFATEVGKARFFLKGYKEDVTMMELFSTFNSKEYIPIVKLYF